MNSITPEYVVAMTYNACQQIQTDPRQVPEWEMVALVLGTAAVESGFKSDRDRPGLGIWGMDFRQMLEIYSGFRHKSTEWRGKGWKFRKKQWQIFAAAWLGISGIPYIELSSRDMRYLIANDIRFGAAIVRWYYLLRPGEEPETLTEVAEQWAYLYCPEQAVTREPSDFMDAWHTHNCSGLMQSVGYR